LQLVSIAAPARRADGCEKLEGMETHADNLIGEVLRAEEMFLIVVGRLTLLFSLIEDSLVIDARRLVALLRGCLKSFMLVQGDSA